MDHADFCALRLAREGFAGGNPEVVMEMRADTVLNMIHFLNFEGDYHDAYKKLNT